MAHVAAEFVATGFGHRNEHFDILPSPAGQVASPELIAMLPEPAGDFHFSLLVGSYSYSIIN
jgi:hypothetical protein